MKHFLVTILVISLSCSVNNEKNHSGVLLFNVNIIDVETGRIDNDQSLIIDKGIITSIGDFKDLVVNISKENRIDLDNKFLVPGYWDFHVHIDKLADNFEHAKQMLSLYTLNGVTSIKEMGGDWEVIKPLKIASGNSKMLPDVYSAGPIFENKAFVDWIVEIDDDPDFRKQRIGISSVDQVSTKVDSVLSLGVDFLKIRTAASREVFFELARQAKLNDVKFSGHVDAKVDLYDAINSGISSLEHLDIFQLNGMGESKMDSVISRMKEMQTGYTPTLIYFKNFRIYDKQKIHSFIDDTTDQLFTDRAYASNSLLNKTRIALTQAEGSQVPWKELEKGFMVFAEKVINSDIPVLAGTDGANALVLPGFSIHDELALYRSEFEMDNLKIVQSATINPAKNLGITNAGLIKEGHTADLVVLDKNPLMDIKNSKTIYMVIKSGNLITKKEIDEQLKLIRERNKSMRKSNI